MHKLKKLAVNAYNSIDNIFTDKEAWGLFRLAAFVETVGWTCLIIGIVTDEMELSYGHTLLAVGGSIHGILYIFYVFIVLFGHRSMKWSVWRFLFAEGISVVPYGALVFELWVSYRRRNGKI